MTDMTSSVADQATRVPSLDRLSPKVAMAIVFLTAMSLIFLESILFHALLFVSTYTEATMAIPIALLGISIGALAVYIIKTKIDFTLGTVSKLYLGISLSFVLTFALLCLQSSSIFSFPYFLLVPFILGSIVLSYFFMSTSSNKIYFADLIGAGAGAILAALTIEFIGTDASFFFGAALLALCGILFSAFSHPKRLNVYSSIFIVLLLASTSIVIAIQKSDFLNMAVISQTHKTTSSGKVFRYIKREPKGRYRKLIYSHSSASGRTDAVGTFDKKSDQIRSVLVFHNGLLSDSFKFKDVPGYALDPRVPWGFFRNPDPDSLIIGTSAEGVVSAVSGMGKGKVWGVEICTGKVNLMTHGVGKEYTYDAYQHLHDLEIIDARSYLNNHPERKFDHITMMNAHLGQRLARAAAPEYLHTVDALLVFFDHLTPRGIINIEETSNRESLDDDANVKLTHTILESLKQLGTNNPGDHLYIFRWSDYIQWFIKKTPFSDTELKWLDNWLEEQVKNLNPRPFVVTPSIVWHPQKDTIEGPIAAMIRSNGSYTKPDTNLDFTTDDKPFGFDIQKSRPILYQAIFTVMLIAIIFVFIPVSIITFKTLRVRLVEGTSMILFFGALGIAYLLIEIMLIQRYQMYVGTPVGSIIAILGGMLFFSGLGSYYSPFFGKSRVRTSLVFVLIAILGVALLAGLDSIFKTCSTGSLPLRMLVSVLTIAPLAFFMGMPFPLALTIAKNRNDNGAGALMFSVNGALSAIATPISCLISIDYGFRATLLVGVVLYLILMVFMNVFYKQAEC